MIVDFFTAWSNTLLIEIAIMMSNKKQMILNAMLRMKIVPAK
jgi:hypothetical protein